MSSQCRPHRSPYCGEPKKFCTSRSKAPGRVSFKKCETSSGDGGNPRRSKLSRRMSFRRSASGASARSFFASADETNASIAFEYLPAGKADRTNGWNAQCVAFVAATACRPKAVTTTAAVGQPRASLLKNFDTSLPGYRSEEHT